MTYLLKLLFTDATLASGIHNRHEFGVVGQGRLKRLQIRQRHPWVSLRCTSLHRRRIGWYTAVPRRAVRRHRARERPRRDRADGGDSHHVILRFWRVVSDRASYDRAPRMIPTPEIAHLRRKEYADHVYDPAEDTFALMDAIEEDGGALQALGASLCVEIGYVSSG